MPCLAAASFCTTNHPTRAPLIPPEIFCHNRTACCQSSQPSHYFLRHVAFSTSTSTTKNKKRNFGSNAIPFDISPPPIDHDHLLDTATEEVYDNLEKDRVIETFDNDIEALDAAELGVAVVDVSNYGRIRVGGDDRIQFLHNQSTANFETLKEGQGCDTVFVTPTARTVDIAQAWIMKNAITLVVSPVTVESVTKMLQKYIFFADKVEIQDITNETRMYVLVGPTSNQIIDGLNLGDLIGLPYGSHKHYTVNGMPITVAVGSIISKEGFSLLMSPAAANIVWKALISRGAVPMGTKAWEMLRILQGRPAPNKELTDEFNVLEAGLWDSVSLNKGCYKGQETISRLVTYDGIKQRLWGIRLSSAAEPGTTITVDGKKVGKMTSVTTGRGTSEVFGLGYIKRKTVSVGATVNVGEGVIGTVVEVPFLAQQQPPPKNLTL